MSNNPGHESLLTPRNIRETLILSLGNHEVLLRENPRMKYAGTDDQGRCSEYPDR